MKNELIIASYKDLPRGKATQRLDNLLAMLGIEEMRERYFPSDARATDAPVVQHSMAS
jgi:hypothetical protein